MHARSFLVGLLAGAGVAAGLAWLSEDQDRETRVQPPRAPADDEHGTPAATEAPATEPPAPDDAEALLRSPRRLDQVRAIEATKNAPESASRLLEWLLETDDPILAQLLQEALLDLESDMLPALQDAFLQDRGAAALKRLAALLGRVGRDPGRERAVVAFLVRAMQRPGLDRQRELAARSALRAIGPAAIGPVAKLFADPHVPAGIAESAAWILAGTDPSHAQEVRTRVAVARGELIESMRDTTLTGGQREELRLKTRWLAWTVTNRPQDEHDPLGSALVEDFLRAEDPEQTGALAWGIANLQGMTPAARAAATRTILDALRGQPSREVRQWYAWAVVNLAIEYGNAPLDGPFFRIVEEAEARRGAPNLTPETKRHLDWIHQALQDHIRKQRERE